MAPHGLRHFKPSTDPAFAADFEDVVGLYMAPPKHAIVRSIDEKSQIQANRQLIHVTLDNYAAHKRQRGADGCESRIRAIPCSQMV